MEYHAAKPQSLKMPNSALPADRCQLNDRNHEGKQV